MGQQTYSTAGSTTFTVPTAVKSLDIVLIGAGGAGVNAANGAGAGGGAYLDKSGITTTPTSTFPVVVGAGGTSEGAGGNTDWNSGEYIAGGGGAGSGSTGGSGGAVSGSGTPTTSQAGGSGGNGCHTDCTLCSDCECNDPPDCNSYGCFDSSSSSSCDARGGGGSSGTASGTTNGGGGSCNCTGTDNCGFATGSSCTDGSGGVPPTTPGGDGGNGGSNGVAPGGGAGGGNTSGADGYLNVSWTSGSAVYTSQPTNTTINATISSVVVECRFSDGSVDTSFNGPVTIAIFNNPSGGTLSGTTTVNASSGVATFSDLSIDQVGTGYTLIVQDADGFLNNGFSNPFNITAVATKYYTYLDKLAARLGNLIPKIIR